MIDAREWLEPDGRGGYVMGAADGVRSRRYHSYLLSASKPPEGRKVLVGDLEVFVETPNGRFALSGHRYRGDIVYPDGPARLVSFAWLPWPRWEWRCEDGTHVACELVCVPEQPRTHMRWLRVAGDGPASLWVRPLLAGRDYHSLHHENGAFRFDADVHGQRVSWSPYDGVATIRALANARYDQAPDWYRHFIYAWDRERGLDYEEDLASPGAFTFDLAAGPAALVLASDELPEQGAREIVDNAFAAERKRRQQFPTLLHRAASQYVAARADGKTIIAGYPWFADWGRDTFVSLRGTCLATGHRDTARKILAQWAKQVSEGMLPNRYDENDEQPEFNSVDASLWFVIAADAAGDGDPAIHHAIDEIVAGYARGTRHRIGATDDGLLACGVPGLQLTWMDAKVDDEVVTPRIGKPVEVQALWINALAIAGKRDPKWRALADKARAAFNARFWSGNGLYDVVDCDHFAGTTDATCRPNQIFAVGGLPLQIVDGDRARAIVDVVEQKLWTPAGLRSLAQDDDRYRGRYVGDRYERDHSYHNGPVWPWLAGPFVEAWVRVRGNTSEAKREARRRFFEPLLARLELAGMGHLSEICDGDAPHRPVGCPFQAWSMAEALRLDEVVLT